MQLNDFLIVVEDNPKSTYLYKLQAKQLSSLFGSGRFRAVKIVRDADSQLTIRFTDLRERVLALEGFEDDPKSSNEPKLEAIQMAWHEEYTDVEN